MRSILIVTLLVASRAPAGEIVVKAPLSPPAWAFLQRELLKANTAACREYFQRYFDERGYLLCVERWGGDDGPDDAIENLMDWPILHALGANDVVLKMVRKAWEGHLRQYTQAKTTHVPFAKDGMYYKEFPVMFDWLHNGEGLTVFNLQGLSDSGDRLFQQRVKRFAGFYMNEDPGAPNYDEKHHIIRSMFNGSRGPLLRKATGLDWAGDPIEIENRFKPGHGERTYQEMLDHFKDYNDIVGDHPLNLQATSLHMNAYFLTGEEKYRRWVLEYVGAWRERMIANGHLIPTNIGLDGKIGSETGGKWYGGVYGWGFTVKDPVTGKMVDRNSHAKGFIGFMNAYFLTGDDRWLEPWRKQMDAVNAQKKVIEGKDHYPRMYGDKGWYGYSPEKYSLNARELYYLSMKDDDRKRILSDAWFSYLEGKNPTYPEAALRRDLNQVRQRVEGMRKDTTTPDTRLADDPMKYNPASVNSLIEQMLGGLPPGKVGSILHCRLRYFDPVKKRAGIPEDVAALIERMDGEQVVLTLVNINQLDERRLILQAGGYGEHRFAGATVDGEKVMAEGSHLTVRLEPGAGSRLVLSMKRYVGKPSMTFPGE